MTEEVMREGTEIKIQYFKDYWKDLTRKNNSIEKELVHSILYNPRELFKEFIEEIERKNLSNRDNKSFFIDKINEFSRLDLETLTFIKPTLTLIQQQFSKQDDYSYLVHLLKIAEKKLENFILGKRAVEELTELLTNDSEINTKKIKHLTNLIIFELIHKKYSDDTITKIMDDLFNRYQIINGILYTDFPHNIRCNKWKTSSSEFQACQKKLQEYLDNLTCRERILAINNYFTKKPEKLRFVFQVKGLKGDDVNITIGGVQIYNPKTTKLFTNPEEPFDEFFSKEELKENIYCNGAVTLKIIDTEYARQEALHILENALDIIASKYPDYKVPLTINTSQYFVIDEDGEQRGGDFFKPLEFMTFRDSLELENSKYNNLLYARQVDENRMLTIDKKILESIHWKRKAIESNDNHEKILWHWVVLENIFDVKSQSTPKVIFEVVSKLLAKKYIYTFAWKHYSKLDGITNFQKQITLPNSLKDTIGLNSKKGETLYLKKLIDNIDSIQSNLDESTLFYEQLGFLQEIFLDTKKCLDLIEKFEKLVFEKLVYLYRIRNKIVHNAHSQNNPLYTYYIEFIASISATSIQAFIEKRDQFSLKTSEEIIHNIRYDYDTFKLELNKKGTDVLLDLKIPE